MLSHVSHIAGQLAGHVYRRGAVEGDNPHPADPQTPGWVFLVFLANLIVFLPLLIIMGYTFETVFPVFAMVEDENAPPAYQAVRLDEDDATSLPGDMAIPPPVPPKMASESSSQIITSSFRRTRATLLANGGFRAYFRGLRCLAFQRIVANFIFLFFSQLLPKPFSYVSIVIASLVLVQFSAAWVHVVLSPSPAPFWRRLPSFKVAFAATAKPTLLYYFSVGLNAAILYGVTRALHMSFTDTKPGEMPTWEASDGWKACIVTVVSFLGSLLIVMPAQIVLVRVQASLLPPDAETIIPFDRSFQGTVEPVVVGGKGYVSITDAWKTFSMSSWRRLVILYIKIALVSFGLVALMATAIIPQFIFISHILPSKA